MELTGPPPPAPSPSDAWAFDLKSKTWAELTTASLTTAGARSSHTCTLHADSGTVLIFGGLVGQSTAIGMSDVWAWSLSGGDDGPPTTGTWTRLFASNTGGPGPRFDHTAVLTARG